MKRQLLFFYRYITTRGRWRRWLNPQTVMLVTVSVVFLTTLAWTAPYSVSGSGNEAPQLPRTPTVTATALPGDALAAAAAADAAADAAPAATEVTPSQLATPTRTPLPPEYMETNPQTIGISLAAVMIVLIVVAGAGMFMPPKDEDQ